MATLTAQPAQVSEGETIEVEIRLSLPYGGNATSTLQLIVTDADGALVAPLPTGAEFDPGELTDAITLTAADNAVHNDARVVTVALAPSPDASLYTLGAPSSATVVVADNDNVAPVFSDGASATRSVAENTAAGENVGAALTATDTDAGDTLTYTLEGADAASFDIVSTSGQIRTRPGVTYDPRGQAELLRHRQGRRRQRRHRHRRGDDHGDGRGRAAGGAGAADRHGDLRKHHERGCDLDRAGQPGQAGHQRLRPALPGGHQRELDRRPAGTGPARAPASRT